MKKWMIFMRESDNAHFLWNGEHPIRVSSVKELDITPLWHHSFGQLPDSEAGILDHAMNGRARIFNIIHYGRYQVVARGKFKEL